MNALTVTLSPDLDAFVQTQVETAGYVTPGEVVREALMLLQEREERRAAKLAGLRAEVQRGFDSGPAQPMDIEAIKRLGRERLAADAAETDAVHYPAA